ncbi:hypothetical protein CDAR_93141 [Caerostris darwini]|uniref:Uncharacterized protein n=1 Tax=Caerostris darwini TaxID=1538125 RepID=A0AAV4VP01_9ARAC|nr:hypothetical protein CDAR_93141 [Caerostris darwini]
MSVDEQVLMIRRQDPEMEKMSYAFDKKKYGTTSYKSAQAEVMKKTPLSTGEPTKTQSKYRGLLIITDVLPSNTYRVTQLGKRAKDILTLLQHM